MELETCRFFRSGVGVGSSLEDWLTLFQLGIGALELGFVDEILFDLLYCSRVSNQVAGMGRSISVPLRRCVPSGRFAGPTEKPLRALFAVKAASFASS